MTTFSIGFKFSLLKLTVPLQDVRTAGLAVKRASGQALQSKRLRSFGERHISSDRPEAPG